MKTFIATRFVNHIAACVVVVVPSRKVAIAMIDRDLKEKGYDPDYVLYELGPGQVHYPTDFIWPTPEEEADY